MVVCIMPGIIRAHYLLFNHYWIVYGYYMQ